ncbi:hypothetical protein P7C70_g4346, partial [Phenoliferia sp. Uapishka_3]
MQVTEKTFQPLEFGSVPIHLGSPTYNQSFLPAPNTAIDLAEYLPAEYLELSTPSTQGPGGLSDAAKAGVRRLADRLRHLSSAEGQSDYERMLDWKKNDDWKKSPFGKVVEIGREPIEGDCRLAGILKGHKWAETNFTRSEWSKSV